ncbi:UDP-N-acetylmuramoyl-L-alanyl-D-glutamate--2,6-diaminopimelate ligase [Actinomycetaceae bacterium MB13-C1-2]|nr:UDP-N-acetylmuramoyl-L-alanyl-D-glutamate--2,6-diaminopimelate ligase [Actinomycetaceae bacterium MB13-C1-2]
MSALVALRPTIEPRPLSELLNDLPDARFVPTDLIISADQVLVSGVSVDSPDMGEGWIFVGVPGSKHGANFAKDAVASGASVLVTDARGAEIIGNPPVPLVTVSDPRTSAAILAKSLYAPYSAELHKVGVTGTNGKTTTTYLTRAALGGPKTPVAVLSTVEIDTGATRVKADRTTHEAPVVGRALALAQQQGCASAVIEVSSHALEMGRVEGIHFDVGIFTNLQHDHLDFHGDMDSYLRAKARLFESGRTDSAVIAVDDQYGRRLVTESPIPVQAVQVLSEDDPMLGEVPLWRAASIVADANTGGSRFSLVSPDGEQFAAACPLPGPANVQDAALAIVAANVLGVPLSDAIANLEQAPPVDGRCHWVQKPSEGAPAVMVDSGHTPEAISVLLDVVRPLTAGRIIAVFGTDGDRDATKRAPLAEVFARKADLLVITDENPRTEDAAAIRRELLRAIASVRPDMRGVVEVREGRRAAIRHGIAGGKPGDLIVITGKGGERVQEWNGEAIPFYDPDVAEEEFEDLGYQSALS